MIDQATYDFELLDGWGGAYAHPLTQVARDHTFHLTNSPNSYINLDEGKLVCDHRDAIDMAKQLAQGGFTFIGSDKLLSGEIES